MARTFVERVWSCLCTVFAGAFGAMLTAFFYNYSI